MSAAKRPKYPGIGERIRERLVALGYVKNGHADVEGFIVRKGYGKTLFRHWLTEQRAPGRDLERLAHDLLATKGWLCFGDEKEGADLYRGVG